MGLKGMTVVLALASGPLLFADVPDTLSGMDGRQIRPGGKDPIILHAVEAVAGDKKTKDTAVLALTTEGLAVTKLHMAFKRGSNGDWVLDGAPAIRLINRPKPAVDIDYLMFDAHGNFYFRLKDGGYANPFTGKISSAGNDQVVRGGEGAMLGWGPDGILCVTKADGKTRLKE